MANDDDIRLPEEGLSTLVIQFTKRELDRLGRAITALRTRGDTEEAIRAHMKRNLGRFDAHTLDRIYRRSLGETPPDDIPASDVVKEEPVKKNTVAVEARGTFPHLAINSLVQYRGEEWFVQRLEGKRYVLKKVL